MAILCLLISAGLAEIVLGVAAPQPTFSRLSPYSPRCFRKSEVVPAELQPHARTRLKRSEFDHPVTINGQGMRMDREVSHEPKKGTRRVVVVGDSFTFGHGVLAREAYPQLLEARLADRTPRVEVLNLGFALGFSPDAYYAGLRKKRFGGQVLVVQVFVANDLTAGIETRWHDRDHRGLPRRVTTAYTYVDDEHRHRVKDTLWRYQVPVLRDSHLVVGLARLIRGDENPLRSTYRQAMMEIGSPVLYRKRWPPVLEQLFADQVACLLGVQGLARDRDQEMLVVIVPHPDQVYLQRFKGKGADRVLERRLRTKTRDEVPQRRLLEALQSEGVACLDLLPALIHAQSTELYFERDGHWTAQGHQVVAEALASDLEERGWLAASREGADSRNHTDRAGSTAPE